MKKRIFTFVLIITILASNIVLAKDYPQKFWDVPKNHWAFTYIADLADRKVINGYEDGSFKPDHTVSRAEWAKIMVEAAGVQTTDNAVYFRDMSANHWANKYVNAAKNYLTGYADGLYRPEQATTREDVTVAMVKLKGYDTSNVDYSYLTSFTDVYSISNYAKVYVAVAVQNNLISGFDDNTFRGQDTLTRAEAATLLYRAFQLGSANKITNLTDMPINTTDTVQTTDNGYTQQAQITKPIPDSESKVTSEPTPEPTPSPKRFISDTIAQCTKNIMSMVIDNNDIVHWIEWESYGEKCTLVNSLGKKLDLTKDVTYELEYDDKNFDFSISCAYLAYDSKNDILYLLGNQHNRLSVYNLSDYDNPRLLLNEDNCPIISEEDLRVKSDVWLYEQVSFFENGAMLCPTNCMDVICDPNRKSISVYPDIRFSNFICNGKAYYFSQNSDIFTVTDLQGQNEKSVSIEGGEVNTMIWCENNKFYTWNDEFGVVTYDTSGYMTKEMPIDEIECLDYKTLTLNSPKFISVSTNGTFAFVDYQYNIRIIKER